MDARAKAFKNRRKRLQPRGMKRVEVTVRAEHVPLVRDIAAKLRANPKNAQRIKAALNDAANFGRGKSLAQALHDPVIAAPAFDDVFDEIERARRDPIMRGMRDIAL